MENNINSEFQTNSPDTPELVRSFLSSIDGIRDNDIEELIETIISMSVDERQPLYYDTVKMVICNNIHYRVSYSGWFGRQSFSLKIAEIP